MGLVKILFNLVVLLIISVSAILFIPGIPPDVDFQSFSIPDPIKLEGWFQSNTVLDEAELYYESTSGTIESLAVVNDDEIYTGDPTGSILKITGKQVAKPVTKLQFPCGDIPQPWSDHGSQKLSKCSSPLGMRIVKGGKLLLTDYYGGVVKVDLKTGDYENLVVKTDVNGKFPFVPEDVHEAKDGNVYWTDGSTTGDFFTEMLAQPSGRLLKYDPKSRRSEVILENLHFSNGVCLSDDEDFVLAVESGSNRITRYFLRGEKKGQSDIFVERLPGYPDNLRSNGRGGFYVGMILPWNEQYSMNVHTFSPRPLIRKLILRSRHLLLSLINHVKPYLPENVYLSTIEQHVVALEHILKLGSAPTGAMVIELSKNGEIIGVFNGKLGNVHSLSQISIGNKYAFLISPIASKIWRIELNSLRKTK